MLPNPENAPATCPKRAPDQFVPPLISFQFPLPKHAVIHRKIRVLGATMPETAIHKNCQLELGKDKIWFAEYCKVATPSGDALAAEEFHQGDFCFFVPTTADARHHLRSFGWRKDIGHALHSDVSAMCFRPLRAASTA